MKVTKFFCGDFRNFETFEWKPGPGMNVICGANAQGKTNLLEGIWLFTGAKSFRGAKDSELIKFGAPKAKLALHFISKGIENTAEIQIENRRIANFNEKNLPSTAALAGHFCAIVFSPADLSLVKDGPAVRRKFMDLAIGQLYPKYIVLLRDYMRAVTQRNSILRDLKYHSELAGLLDVFEQELALKGAELIGYRQRYLQRISESLPGIYHGLSGQKETLQVNYSCSCEADELASKLKQLRRDDMFLGSTSIGPHRDDILFLLDGISARSFGSQGQKRSIVLALKLAEADVLKQETGELPVALLDDVMSELDPDRQDFILNHIRSWQVFLTCCDPSNVSRLAEGNIFWMKNGQINVER